MLQFLEVQKILLKNEWRNIFPSRVSLLIFSLAEVMTFSVYHFMAKALAPRESFTEAIGSDYFGFVVLGHLSLLIPSAVMQRPVKAFRESMHYSFFDRMLTSKKNAVRQTLFLTGPIVWLRSFHLLINVAILTLVFSWIQSLDYWFFFSFVTVLALPGFLGLGLLATSVVVYFGRGDRFVFMFSNLAQIAAGIYFPVTVFSKDIEQLLLWLSPFNQLLAMHRNLAHGLTPSVGALTWTLLQGLLFCILGWYALQFSFQQRRKKSIPLVLQIS